MIVGKQKVYYYQTDEEWRKNKYNQLVSFKRDTLIDRKQDSKQDYRSISTWFKSCNGRSWNTHGDKVW